jgi:oligopeptide/dipeptide ABC transporter ATP-binding protein
MDNNELILEVKDLRTYFPTYSGLVHAVDGVSFTIKRGKNLGVVGESGCGKSVTALTIMGLVPSPPAKISGEIIFYKESNTKVELHKLDPKGPEYRSIRGKEMAMIFQEPMTSLNPVYTIGEQIMEAIMLHQKVDKEEARKKAIEMLDKVGIPSPEKRIDEYPHQLSGGMRQRVMIAMALSCNPSLLIADEPTTALDVTIQAQILELMKALQREFNTSIMIITHNLGVVAEMANEVMVMYLGEVVEYGDVREIFRKRLHPYTDGLFKSIPRAGRGAKQPLTPIQGSVPEPIDLPKSCRFLPRCNFRFSKCENNPPLFTLDNGHKVKCWLYEDGGAVI